MATVRREIKPGEYLRRSQSLLQKVERRLGSGDAYKFKIGIAHSTGRKEVDKRVFSILAYTNKLMLDYMDGLSRVAEHRHAGEMLPLQLNTSVAYELNSALASIRRPWFWQREKTAALRDTMAESYKLSGRTFGGLVRLLREHPELEKAHKERVMAGEMAKWGHKEYRELWEKTAVAESGLKRILLKHVARMAGIPPKKKE